MPPKPSTTCASAFARCSAGGDTVGEFLRQTLAPTLVYTARVAPVIASSIDDVDRVMQWGFGWELGPFELFDAIGVREVVDAWRAQAPENEVPPLVREVLDRGRNRFRRHRFHRPRRACRSYGPRRSARR